MPACLVEWKPLRSSFVGLSKASYTSKHKVISHRFNPQTSEELMPPASALNCLMRRRQTALCSSRFAGWFRSQGEETTPTKRVLWHIENDHVHCLPILRRGGRIDYNMAVSSGLSRTTTCTNAIPPKATSVHAGTRSGPPATGRGGRGSRELIATCVRIHEEFQL